MIDKDLKFTVISTIISIISISIILGSTFLEDKRTQIALIIVSLGILIIQKISEVIFLKKTRKISIPILIILIIALIYLIVNKL